VAPGAMDNHPQVCHLDRTVAPETAIDQVRQAMKVNVEIDCSPEEARRFMGLPDVTKANDAYMDGIIKAMQGVGNVDQLQEFARQVAPMGQMGLKLFQQLMESGAGFGMKPKHD